MNRTRVLIALVLGLLIGGTRLLPAQTAQQTFSPGLYDGIAYRGQLQLNVDGSFALDGSFAGSGHFTVNGDRLSMIYSDGTIATFQIIGKQCDDIYNNDGVPMWRWQKDASSPAALPAAPLKLPLLYVSTQSPTDQLQLNTDHSFSLQEGGQPYHGTFMANGNALELNINETGTKTTLGRQGNDLADSSGQTWSLREQPAVAAPAGAMLHNEDIIKMAQAGLDDAIIISKINSSKCQFDTSTDALIQLKKQGVVSAPVLKAMVATEK